MTNKKTTPLKEKRLERGLSLGQVERETGIPKTNLFRIENGQIPSNRPHAHILYQYYDREVSLLQIYDPFFADESE